MWSKSFMKPMSAPAAKAFSLPVRTMQPMPSSASKASMAAPMPSTTSLFKAFMASGRLMRMRPTRPWISVSTTWDMGVLLGVVVDCCRPGQDACMSRTVRHLSLCRGRGPSLGRSPGKRNRCSGNKQEMQAEQDEEQAGGPFKAATEAGVAGKQAAQAPCCDGNQAEQQGGLQ